jgi:hypothetical protein
MDPRDVRVPPGYDLNIFSSGYQIARYCPQQRDWYLIVQGVEIKLTDLISKLAELQGALHRMRG